MDSQSNPAADDIEVELNQTFIQLDNPEDEKMETDDESSDSEELSDPNKLILDDESSDENSERKQRWRVMSQAALRGESMQKALFKMKYPEPPVRPEYKPKIFTPEEIALQEQASRAMEKALTIPSEIDDTYFEHYRMPVDETLPEVRQLTQSGFITARTVHTIIQKTQTQKAQQAGASFQVQSSECIYPVGVLTQLEAEGKRRSFPKTVDSDEEIDDETFKQVLQDEEKHDLNYSLGNLSQVLSSSGKAAEFIQDSVARSQTVDLNKTRLDVAIVSSDDEDEFPLNTEALELNFLMAPTQFSQPVKTPPPSPIKISFNESCEDIFGETEELENEFLNSKTQADVLTQKPTETRRQRSPFELVNTEDDSMGETEGLEYIFLNSRTEDEKLSQQAPAPMSEDELDVSFGETETMESIFLNAKTQVDVLTQKHSKVKKQPNPLNESFVDTEAFGETEALENEFLNSKTQSEVLTQSAPETKNLQMSSGIGNTGMFSGFSLASGKSSNKSLNTKSGDSEIEPPVNQPIPAFSGFGLASGKSIKMKNSLLNRFEKAFLEADEKIAAEVAESKEFSKTPLPVRKVKFPSNSSSLNTSFITTPESSKSIESPAAKMPMMGFSTASGSSYKLKGNNLSEISKKFAQEDARLCQELENNPIDEETPVKPHMKKLKFDFDNSPSAGSPVMQGFKRGINRQSTPFLSRVQKAERLTDSQEIACVTRILENCETQDLVETPLPVRQSFKVPVNSPSVRNNSLNNASLITTPESSKPNSRLSLKRQHQDDSFSSFVPLESPAAKASMMGFSTASGASCKLKGNTLSEISKKFAEEDEKFCQELEKDPVGNETPVKSHMKKLKLNFDSPAAKLQTNGFAAASGASCQLKTNKQSEKSKEPIDYEASMRLPVTKVKFVPKNSPAAASPLMQGFKRGINRHSTPFLSRVQKNERLTDSQELACITKILENCDTQDLCESPPPQKRKKLAKVRLLYKMNESDDDNDESHQGKLLVPNQVKILRAQALEAQTKSIKEKAHCEKAQMAGSVFMMKSSRNRLKVREFLDNERPKFLNRHEVTFSNAIDYKFDMKNFLTEEVCRTNVDGVSLADNAKLFMDDKGKVGFKEIKSAFLASPGVDPKLAEEAWVENTFKMLVLKFAWLENSFTKFERFEVLSPENLLLQMKYRYDRAIDRYHRSAIHKIVELDDVPCRRMVLKVLDVIESLEAGYELVVSDGWHSIKAKIDSGLAGAVDRQKITVGTKLITSNAEIIGCGSGFDPLNLPDTARLVIHANSTRRTCWDARLGYCANPNPIRIPLDSVLSTGGTNGKLVVVVTHVYQVIYVDSSKEPKEFRSEKLQLRLQNKLDVLHFSIYETIARQVQLEEFKELAERVAALKQKKVKTEDLNSEEICDLLDFETDADNSFELQAKLSHRKLRKAQEIRDERVQKMNSVIRERLGDREKNLSKLLKFRVVDAMNPKKTALVSCWIVHDELIDMVKQGRVLEIMKSTVGLCNKELQVTVGKSGIFRRSKLGFPQTNFKKFFRNETKISEIGRNFHPPQDEFDVACVIVHIESKDTERSVKVYVADEDANMLCLNFWSNLRDSAFDDVVIEGSIVYAKNLQWRLSNSNEKIPQAFVSNDTTSFILSPKQESQAIRLAELRVKIGQMDEFLTKCREKIGKGETINKENNITMNSTINQSIESRPNQSRSFTTKATPIPASGVLRKRLGMNFPSFSKEISSPRAPANKKIELSGLQRYAFGRR